jgi:endonuclease YncB( thermonuclease family)
MPKLSSVLIALAALALPSVAFADPCGAPLLRRAGEHFSGVVRYIGDGDGLCVGASTDPSTWIEVRLADFNAPELNAPGGRAAKAALERIAMGRAAECVAGGGRNGRVVSYDRVIAVCRIGGRRIGDLMREAGIEEGGR